MEPILPVGNFVAIYKPSRFSAVNLAASAVDDAVCAYTRYMKPRCPYALAFGRYRELMAADYIAFRGMALPALTKIVPTCSGWNGEQLVRHTALVYLHKAATIRTGKKPSGHWLPDEIRALDALPLLTEGYDQLIEQFESHDPTAPAESWVADDQTVGFWIRRLAHETSIHRRDIEAALGPLTPVGTELAIDGIDEILTVMLGRSAQDKTATGTTVEIDSAGKVWTVTLHPDAAAVVRNAGTAPAGRITGEPSDVLLYLWGRAPLPEGTTGTAAVAELRSRLAKGT